MTDRNEQLCPTCGNARQTIQPRRRNRESASGWSPCPDPFHRPPLRARIVASLETVDEAAGVDQYADACLVAVRDWLGERGTIERAYEASMKWRDSEMTFEKFLTYDEIEAILAGLLSNDDGSVPEE